MCGICGVVGGGADVRRMAARLAHRGPDDEGYFEGILGFRRLAIIDLETGAQPMKGCRDLRLVFNGEIYNHRELRARLDHPFRTRSDAEVILHLYEERGSACVRELDGMFAFAVWDPGKRTLFAARDRLGKKPFVYWHSGERFQFASELAALDVPRRIDRTALEHYLAFGYIPAPLTIFEGVRKLPPGHTLAFDGRDVRVERYWEPKVEPVEQDEAACAEQVREALTEAVRKRLVADVPLGAFLSGGLDSTIVAGLMSRMQPARTFTMGFREPEFDERAYAREAAGRFGSVHLEFEARPDAAEALPLLAERHGEPFGDPSSIPTFFLARGTAGHVKAVLSGDGGDELFGGYRRHRAIAWMSRVRRWPGFLLRAGAGIIGSRSNYAERIGRMLRRPEAPLGELYAELMSVFTRPQRQALGFGGEVESFLSAPFGRFESDPAAAAGYADLVTYLPNDILAKVDAASMAHGLEVRCPFLDAKVVELALSIPSRLRLGKRLLRKAFGDLVPRSILGRPKKGFGVPVAAWLRGELRPLLEGAMGSLERRGLFEAAGIRRLVGEHLEGQRDHRDRLWLLLVFELWARRFLT